MVRKPANREVTSKRAASAAARVLRDPKASKTAKSAVGSVLGTSDPEVIQSTIDWLYENRSEGMSAAIRNQLTRRSTSGYKTLATDFLSNLDTIAPDAILNADMGSGISANRDSAGKINVTIPDGRSLSWKDAVRLGFAKLG